jgi:two-component system chemotaxis response regulator CheY
MSEMSANRRKVLVVDDSQLMHKMYELALRAYPGCEVEAHFAANGYEGLAQLKCHPDTDLIMLDVNMPTMSGLEFLAHVKGEPVLREIPVVLQTSEDSEDDMRRGLEAGAEGYLTKPFTPDRVHGVLDQIFS